MKLLTGIKETARGWEVQTVGKGIRRTIQTQEVIDCTGDADVVGMAGYQRQKSEVRQPGTLIFRFGGYEIDSLDMEVVQELYEEAMGAGLLKTGDFWMGEKQPFINFLRNGGSNQQHIFQADSSTSVTQTQANIEGRKAALRLLKFIQSIPGCEAASLQAMCTQAAIRETYRIVGEKTITYQDYMAGRYFEDALCYSLYFIDVHTEDGVEHEFVPGHRVPTVPSWGFGAGRKPATARGRALGFQRSSGKFCVARRSLMYGNGTGCRSGSGLRCAPRYTIPPGPGTRYTRIAPAASSDCPHGTSCRTMSLQILFDALYFS